MKYKTKTTRKNELGAIYECFGVRLICSVTEYVTTFRMLQFSVVPTEAVRNHRISMSTDSMHRTDWQPTELLSFRCGAISLAPANANRRHFSAYLQKCVHTNQLLTKFVFVRACPEVFAPFVSWDPWTLSTGVQTRETCAKIVAIVRATGRTIGGVQECGSRVQWYSECIVIRAGLWTCVRACVHMCWCVRV